VAAGLLQRVRRESVGQVIDMETAKLLERLRNYPGVTGLKPPLAPQSPVLPITFRRGDERFLLLLADHNRRYATVRHCAGIACGVYVSDSSQRKCR
jgi:selenocysteine lyase/cysteine desulfurase